MQSLRRPTLAIVAAGAALAAAVAVLAPGAFGWSGLPQTAERGQYGPGPNLVVDASASPNPVDVDGTLTYTIHVANKGTQGTNVHLHVELPAVVDVVSTKTDRGPGSCGGSQSLDCPLDFFPGGLKSTTVVVVHVNRSGDLTTRIHADAAEGDANPKDNSITIVPKISAPAAPPTTPGTSSTGTPRPATSGRVIDGSNRADRINGNAKANVIYGLGGNDTINAGGGNDRVYGGAGNDRIDGGPGNDTLDGGPGNDVITGGPGHDVIRGGPGNDTIQARDHQRDVVDCGPGRDTAVVDKIDRVSGCERVFRR